MDCNKINNGEENSYILLEESFYCSSPKIGVVSISNKKENCYSPYRYHVHTFPCNILHL